MLRFVLMAMLAAACSDSGISWADVDTADRHGVGKIEREVQGVSKIRVRKRGTVRTLLFVDAKGGEFRQSQVDLARPAYLLFQYTRMMFASYLLAPQPKRALIVGLGGGAMVHYLRKYDPALVLDVVELDPKVIELARELFAVKPGDHLALHEGDGLVYLRDSKASYDAIYLDAFLAVVKSTDATGVPLEHRTAKFFALVRARLAPGGVAVFNLHSHDDHEKDLEAIRGAFSQVYTFRTPKDANVIAIATLDKDRRDEPALRRKAAALMGDPPPAWIGGKR